MKLYHSPTSVCSIKVRIGLAELGLGYESHMLDLQKGDQRDPDYLQLNASGTVPTLVDDDLVLVESSLIIEYLDREYNAGELMPKGRAAEAAARYWLLRSLAVHDAINSLSFSTAHRDRTLVGKTPGEIESMLAKMPDPVKRMKRKDLLENGLSSIYVQQALRHLRQVFAGMGAALGKGDWISGPEFGIADIALISYIDRIERLGFEGLWTQSAPRIGDWLSAMQARPSYQSQVSGIIDEAVAEKLRNAGPKYWPTLERHWSAAK